MKRELIMHRAHHWFAASILTTALIFSGVSAFNDYSVTQAALSTAE
jgi:hypothetical protein